MQQLIQLLKAEREHTGIEFAAWLSVSIGTGCALGILLAPYFGDIDKLSKVGDFASGIVGPIWSLAAVLFFIAALKVQKDQLVAQKEDLKAQTAMLELQAEELKSQREEMSATKKVFERQKFENTFFNLLEKHSLLLNSLGENFLEKRLKTFQAEINSLEHKYKYDSAIPQKDKHQRLISTFINFLKNNFKKNTRLRSYIKSILCLLIFAKEGIETNNNDKQTFFNIIRYNLTDEEIQILELFSFVSIQGDEVLNYFEIHTLINKDLNFKSINYELFKEKCMDQKDKNQNLIEVVPSHDINHPSLS